MMFMLGLHFLNDDAQHQSTARLVAYCAGVSHHGPVCEPVGNLRAVLQAIAATASQCGSCKPLRHLPAIAASEPLGQFDPGSGVSIPGKAARHCMQFGFLAIPRGFIRVAA